MIGNFDQDMLRMLPEEDRKKLEEQEALKKAPISMEPLVSNKDPYQQDDLYKSEQNVDPLTEELKKQSKDLELTGQDRALNLGQTISSAIQEAGKVFEQESTGRDTRKERENIQAGQERLEKNLEGREALRVQLNQKLAERQAAIEQLNAKKPKTASRAQIEILKAMGNKFNIPVNENTLQGIDTIQADKMMNDMNLFAEKLKSGQGSQQATPTMINLGRSALISSGKSASLLPDNATNDEVKAAIGDVAQAGRGAMNLQYRENISGQKSSSAGQATISRIDDILTSPLVSNVDRQRLSKLKQDVQKAAQDPYADFTVYNNTLNRFDSIAKPPSMGDAQLKDLQEKTAVVEAMKTEIEQVEQLANELKRNSQVIDRLKSKFQNFKEFLLGAPNDPDAKSIRDLLTKFQAKVAGITNTERRRMFGTAVTSSEAQSAALQFPDLQRFSSIDEFMIKLDELKNHANNDLNSRISFVQNYYPGQAQVIFRRPAQQTSGQAQPSNVQSPQGNSQAPIKLKLVKVKQPDGSIKEKKVDINEYKSLKAAGLLQ